MASNFFQKEVNIDTNKHSGTAVLMHDSEYGIYPCRLAKSAINATNASTPSSGIGL